MQGIGYTSDREAKQWRLGKPIYQQHEKITLTSSTEGPREEIVLLEPGCWIQQDLEP